jgi:hypothetical protein
MTASGLLEVTYQSELPSTKIRRTRSYSYRTGQPHCTTLLERRMLGGSWRPELRTG